MVPPPSSTDEPRPVLVIHGVATRDRDGFEADVAQLGAALGSQVRLVPVYWGDFAREAEAVDRVLPYPEWAGRDHKADPADNASVSLRDALSDRDMSDVVSTITGSWQRLSGRSRRRLIGEFYAVVRRQYLRAAAQFTGDLVLYHRRQAELHAVIWETVMRHAPGYGLAEQPIDVISHSLGATMVFDLAVDGQPRLHVDHLITCASQAGFFHAIGASPTSTWNADADARVTLPPAISSWANLYVPLDPWAFLAAPVFRLHDGSDPEDIEVFAGDRSDRIMIHAASHYWSHPVVLATIRRQLGLEPPPIATDAPVKNGGRS